MSLERGNNDTTVAEYVMMRFDAQGRQVSDIQCILYKGEGARQFAMESPSRHSRALVSSATGPAGLWWPDFDLWCAEFPSEYPGKIVCSIFGSGIVCDKIIVGDELDWVNGSGSPSAASSYSSMPNCIFVGGGFGSSLPSPTATTPPGSSSDGGALTYSPPYGFGGGTLPGGSYDYEAPSGVNCSLGGCGGGDSELCYATDPAPGRGAGLDCLPPDWDDGGNGYPSSYDPMPSATTDGLPWSLWAHNKFIDAAFKQGGCQNAIQIMKEASFAQDRDHSGNALEKTLRHALRPNGNSALSRQQVSLLIDEWITNRLTLARHHAVQGHWRQAMSFLGEAIHTLTDRLSPAHTGADGLPLDNPHPLEALTNHSMTDWFGDETSSDITDQMLAQGVSLLVGAMQFVTQGLTKPQCDQYNWLSGP